MNNTEEKLVSEFINKFTQKATEVFEDLRFDDQLELIQKVGKQDAAILFKRVNTDTLSRLLPKIQNLDFLETSVEVNDLAKVVGYLGAETRSNVLAKLPKTLVRDLETVMAYPHNTAGSIMEVKSYLFHPTDLVSDVIQKLRKIKAKNINSIFLVDFDGKLQGRVYLQDLIASDDTVQLKSIAKSTPWVNEIAPKDEIIQIVEKNKVPSVPVLNSEHIVLGVIRHEQLVAIAQEGALDNMQKMVGVSVDEKALSPPLFSVRKRLPWLTINLLTTFVAAFVVGMFEDTIAKITALAILLPVVAGQSGNTGAQAQAVTMRGLALREIRMNHKWRVLKKEGTVGFVNGMAIGLMCSASVYFWSQSLPLAGVIGVAMIFAMVAASLSGAVIPMLLTAIGQDPATSSSIVLTTITDIVGFLSFLGLATIFSSYIT